MKFLRSRFEVNELQLIAVAQAGQAWLTAMLGRRDSATAIAAVAALQTASYIFKPRKKAPPTKQPREEESFRADAWRLASESRSTRAATPMRSGLTNPLPACFPPKRSN